MWRHFLGVPSLSSQVWVRSPSTCPNITLYPSNCFLFAPSLARGGLFPSTNHCIFRSQLTVGTHCWIKSSHSSSLYNRTQQNYGRGGVGGPIQPATCFCTACDLRMVYIFKGLKENPKKKIILWHVKIIRNSNFSVHK